jgi:ligand-binding sensor domain-containing protein
MNMRSAFYIIFLTVLHTRTYAGDTIYTNRFYTQSEGLSSYNVSDITQDKYGLMWIGTQEGLNSFDGNTFKVFNPYQPNTLGGSDIRRVVYDGFHNLIWVAFSIGGISAIDCRTHRIVLTLTEKNIPAIESSSIITNIWVTASNELLIVTLKSCLLFNYDTKSTTILFNRPFNLSGNYTITAACDDARYYYLLTSQVGVICLPKKKKEIVRYIPLPGIATDIDHFLYKVIRSNNRLYMATGRQIGYIDSLLQYHTVCKSVNQITVFNVDMEGYIWYTTDAGLKKCAFKDDSITINIRMVDKAGITDRQQLNLSLFFDNQNNLWMGGSEGLLFSDLSPPVFSRYGYDPVSHKNLAHLYDILPVDSQVYVNDLNGLKLYDCSRKHLTVIDSSGFPYYIFKLPDNNIIFNNDKGFAFIRGKHLDSNNIYKVFPELLTIKHRLLGYHIQMNDSLIILAGEDFKGIIIWNILQHRIREIPPDIHKGWEDNAINALYKASDREIFICQDQGITLFHLDKGIIKTLHLTDHTSGETFRLFFDMQKIKQGYVIAAYSYGIVITDSLFNTIKVINTLNGLSNNGVYRILKDRFDYLWITTNKGLTRINSDNYTCRQYFVEDGLHSNSFEEMSAAYMGSNLIAGGLEGFTIINPANQVKSKLLTNIYFRIYEIKYGDKDSTITDFELPELVLPNNVLQLKVYLSAINFADVQKTTFKYKVAQLHKKWISINEQDFITFLGLEPGTYRLQVQAFNADGIGSEIKEITLIFLPKWYQTWWFKSIIALLIAGFIYGMYRFRINQVYKREQIRVEISNDLHDDIGSTLNSIKVFCNLALANPGNPEYLVQVKEGTQSAITGVRDIMWVLNDKLDSVYDLITRFETFALPLAQANNILLEKHIDENMVYHVLTKEEKRNLYLILKESFNNCIKYAECKCFSYSLITHKTFKKALVIKDNGKGFDMIKHTNGNGLKSMEYRARQIKYNFTVHSSDKGTILKFEEI